MDYEKAYKEAIKRAKVEQETFFERGNISAKTAIERIFPELCESEDEGIRKELIQYLKDYPNLPNGNYCRTDFFAWLEKQGKKINPYSGISFEYNGHIWGMCARDNGVDILLDKQLFTHLKKQDEHESVESMEHNYSITDSEFFNGFMIGLNMFIMKIPMLIL